MLSRLPSNRDILWVLHVYLSLYELRHRLLLRLVNACAANPIFLVLCKILKVAVVVVAYAILVSLHLLLKGLELLLDIGLVDLLSDSDIVGLIHRHSSYSVHLLELLRLVPRSVLVSCNVHILSVLRLLGFLLLCKPDYDLINHLVSCPSNGVGVDLRS